jgi:hypothetical protein
MVIMHYRMRNRISVVIVICLFEVNYHYSIVDKQFTEPGETLLTLLIAGVRFIQTDSICTSIPIT